MTDDEKALAAMHDEALKMGAARSGVRKVLNEHESTPTIVYGYDGSVTLEPPAAP